MIMRVVLLLMCTSMVLFACKEGEKKNPETKQAQQAPIAVSNEKNVNFTLAAQEGLYGKVKRMSRTTFHAKRKGNAIVKVMPGNRYVTLYDMYGQGLERNYYNSAMQLQNKMIYKIDQGLPCTSSKQFNATSGLIHQFSYSYDQSKNKKEESSFNPNGKLDAKKTFSYHKNNLLAEEIIYDGALKFDMRITYKYNAAGHLIESKYYRPSKQLIVLCQISYSRFDKKGNWIKSIEKTNKGGLFIVEREIEYYDTTQPK